MRCNNCKKIVWIWNKFYKKHGKGKEFRKEGKNYRHMGERVFCSDNCYNLYILHNDVKTLGINILFAEEETK